MSEWVEWDAFPDPPKRRRRPKIEVLPPQEPESRIRVDVQHYHHQRRSNQLPPWLPFAVIGFLIALRFLPAIGIALVVIMALMFVSYYRNHSCALGGCRRDYSDCHKATWQGVLAKPPNGSQINCSPSSSNCWT